METKKCTACGGEKVLAEFSKDCRVKDGLRSQCKTCEAEYRKKNAEKIAARNAEYRKKNAEKIAEYSKKNAEKIAEYFAEYRKKNAEKIAARKAEYNEKNAEKRSAYLAEYRKKNAEKIAAYRKTPAGKSAMAKHRVSREIRIKACALANVYAQEIQEIYRLANDTAELAGAVIHVDHICPLKAKVYDPDFDCYLPATGLHVPWNLDPLPAGVNMRKGNRVTLAEILV